MRDSFIFYRSFFEAAQPLSVEQKAQMFDAICNYSLNQKQADINDPIVKAMFVLIKPQLDANNKRYENGKKGGRRKPTTNQNRTKTEPKPNQKETKTEPNKNKNGNVNDNNNENKKENKENSPFFPQNLDLKNQDEEKEKKLREKNKGRINLEALKPKPPQITNGVIDQSKYDLLPFLGKAKAIIQKNTGILFSLPRFQNPQIYGIRNLIAQKYQLQGKPTPTEPEILKEIDRITKNLSKFHKQNFDLDYFVKFFDRIWSGGVVKKKESEELTHNQEMTIYE